MCASYGLGGGPYTERDLPFEPMSDPANLIRLNEWISERNGSAKITGKNALNLNPIIQAEGLTFAWWWLWLDGSGPVKFSAFNSRDDKLMSSWKTPFQQRALLPATWYVEKKVRFELPTNEVFGIAAVTSTVIDNATGEERVTYSMVTRDAVGEAAEVWHRMPLILPRDLHDEWLNPERPGDADLVTKAQLRSDEVSRAMAPAEDRLF